LIALTGNTFASDGVIKIGAAVSLTGKIAYEGRLVKDSYEVWADWVNSHGGIDAGGKNYEVKMIYYDDESTPVRGAKLTEKLITQNKVVLFIWSIFQFYYFCHYCYRRKIRCYYYSSGSKCYQSVRKRI